MHAMTVSSLKNRYSEGALATRNTMVNYDLFQLRTSNTDQKQQVTVALINWGNKYQTEDDPVLCLSFWQWWNAGSPSYINHQFTGRQGSRTGTSNKGHHL